MFPQANKILYLHSSSRFRLDSRGGSRSQLLVERLFAGVLTSEAPCLRGRSRGHASVANTPNVGRVDRTRVHHAVSRHITTQALRGDGAAGARLIAFVGFLFPFRRPSSTLKAELRSLNSGSMETVGTSTPAIVAQVVPRATKHKCGAMSSYCSSLGTFAQLIVDFSYSIFCDRLNRRRVKHRLEFDSGGRKWINLDEEQVRPQICCGCIGVQNRGAVVRREKRRVARGWECAHARLDARKTRSEEPPPSKYVSPSKNCPHDYARTR